MAHPQTTTPHDRQDQFRITGLVAASQRHQRAIACLADTLPSFCMSSGAPAPDVHALSREMLADAKAVEAYCADRQVSPSALPTRSRRAYQWLRYLGKPAHLAQHLRALHYLTHEERRCRPRASLEVNLYLTSNLYQVRARRHERWLTVHEGFVSAPNAILDDLLRVAHTPRRADAAIRRLRAYAAGAGFRRVEVDLWVPLAHDGSPSHQAQGVHHDLNASFNRVNQQNFDGKLARPHLRWSRARTRSKLGHYHPLEDTVVVSKTLDDPRVPAYVLDFIVYHELLHKSLGIETVNGRRRAHTPAFRRAERAHPRYQEVRRFIATFNRTPG